MEKINIRTNKRTELLDITAKIEDVLLRSKIVNGSCVVFCPHTTAGLTINENADLMVKKDILDTLGKLVPQDAAYSHQEGNSDSHLKASFMNPSLQIIIEDAKLCLGTWQGVYLCEFDGPRMRQVWVKIFKDN